MDVCYAYVYITLNYEVHMEIRMLEERYLELDDLKEEVLGSNASPGNKDINKSLFTLYSLLLIALNCLNDVFIMKQEDILNLYEKRIMSLRG